MDTVIDLRDRETPLLPEVVVGSPDAPVAEPEMPAVRAGIAAEPPAARLHLGWRTVGADVLAMAAAVGIVWAFLPPTRWLWAVLAAWPYALASVGSFNTKAIARGTWSPRRVWSATARVMVVLAALGLVLPTDRAGILVAAVLGATTWVTRAMLTRWVSARHQQGQLLTPILARGTHDEVSRFVDLLRRDQAQPLRVAAVQFTDGARDHEGVTPVVAADLDPLDVAMRDGMAAVAFVGAQPEDSTELRRLVWRMEAEGIDARWIPVVAPLAAPEVDTVGTTGMASLSFRGRDLRAETGFVKVTADKVLAAIGLVALSPLLLVVAVAVKRSSSGPVFFRQTRVGRNREHFTMLKFRTMVVDAEAQLPKLAGQNTHDGGTLFKIRNDPRITRVGHFLRKYSLDELPQLINVLRGEMSLVGPRPPLPSEVENYHIDAHRRFRVRPGLTGLWQVSGRSDLDPVESVRLDTLYVENWSPALDVRILASTARVVLTGQGAY